MLLSLPERQQVLIVRKCNFQSSCQDYMIFRKAYIIYMFAGFEELG